MLVLVMMDSRMYNRSAVGDQDGAVGLGGCSGAIPDKDGDRLGSFARISVRAGDAKVSAGVRGDNARRSRPVAPADYGRKVVGGQGRIPVGEIGDHGGKRQTFGGV